MKRIKQAYLLQADYYTATGNALQAKIYNDSLVNTYDTDYRLNTSQYIARAAQRYNAERIVAQESQLRVSRRGMIVISVMALLSIAVAACVITLYLKRNAAYKVLARKAEEWARQGAVSPASTTSGRAAADKDKPEAPTKEDRRIMALADREMAENGSFREADFTLDTLSDRLGIRRNALSRAVNRTTGGNFNSYVNGHRIKEAVRIISETDRGQLCIEEIYERVGFGNRNSFYRTFKQFTGLTPVDFRKSKDS